MHHLILHKTEKKIVKFVSLQINNIQLAYVLVYFRYVLLYLMMVRQKDRNM